VEKTNRSFPFPLVRKKFFFLINKTTKTVSVFILITTVVVVLQISNPLEDNEVQKKSQKEK